MVSFVRFGAESSFFSSMMSLSFRSDYFSGRWTLPFKSKSLNVTMVVTLRYLDYVLVAVVSVLMLLFYLIYIVDVFLFICSALLFQSFFDSLGRRFHKVAIYYLGKSYLLLERVNSYLPDRVFL